jgi:hypothetical protein
MEARVDTARTHILAPKENWFTPGGILGWTDVLPWAGPVKEPSLICVACYVFDCVALRCDAFVTQPGEKHSA